MICRAIIAINAAVNVGSTDSLIHIVQSPLLEQHANLATALTPDFPAVEDVARDMTRTDQGSNPITLDNELTEIIDTSRRLMCKYTSVRHWVVMVTTFDLQYHATDIDLSVGPVSNLAHELRHKLNSVVDRGCRSR